MQREGEEFPEFSETSQKGNAPSESDRDVVDSDSREAIASLERKEKGESSVSKEVPFEELESITPGPVASRTRFHSERIPKLPTTPTKGKGGREEKDPLLDLRRKKRKRRM